LVIVDAPPILAVTDAGLLGAACDGVLLVARVGKTHREHLRMATRLLTQGGGKLLGSVLHRASPKSMGDVVYGAGYGAKYQSAYVRHYGEPSDGARDSETRAAPTQDQSLVGSSPKSVDIGDTDPGLRVARRGGRQTARRHAPR
jgi:Mrp family chromosome partitioning ATPase